MGTYSPDSSETCGPQFGKEGGALAHTDFEQQDKLSTPAGQAFKHLTGIVPTAALSEHIRRLRENGSLYDF